MRIRNIKCEFFTKENKTTCVCRAEIMHGGSTDFFPRHKIANKYKSIVDYGFDSFIVKTTGSAKLNPEDTQDEVLGQRIAESRAKLKLFKLANNINVDVVEFLQHACLDEVITHYQKYNNAFDKEAEHLASLLGITPEKGEMPEGPGNPEE